MVQLTLLSSLEKVFPDSDVKSPAFPGFSMLKNQRASFQVAYVLSGGSTLEAALEVASPIARYISRYEVGLIPGRSVAPPNTDDYYLTKTGGEFPDVLYPLTGDTVTLRPGGAHAFWLEVTGALPAGVFPVTLRLTQGGAVLACASLTVTVIDALLPRQTLLYTNWFHSDCLASYYRVPVFSEEYWRIVESYVNRAGEFGMNTILTPVFTPPLDTQVGKERPTVQLVDVTVTETGRYAFGFGNFDRWIAMCRRCGMEYFEISHFFTQWGAEHAPKIVAATPQGEERIFGWETDAFGPEYGSFLEQFAGAFVPHLEALGIRERCLLHVSDEPGTAQLAAYQKASALIHKCFSGFRVIDALSDFSFYQKKLVDTPIPANDHIEPFIGKVPELWTYYCCAQGGNYVSNRFFAIPSQRNRVLGYQLYKSNAAGFLHWAFNFWFAQFSTREIDPYTESDAGGAFYAGDAYVVYPGRDGTPLDSLRLHVFYDGIQDLLALQLLEHKLGRDAAVALLEQDLETPLTFRDYPHSSAWHLETRERINKVIASLQA